MRFYSYAVESGQSLNTGCTRWRDRGKASESEVDAPPVPAKNDPPPPPYEPRPAYVEVPEVCDAATFTGVQAQTGLSITASTFVSDTRNAGRCAPRYIQETHPPYSREPPNEAFRTEAAHHAGIYLDAEVISVGTRALS